MATATSVRCAECDSQALAALKSSNVRLDDKRILAGLVPHIAASLAKPIQCGHCNGDKEKDEKEEKVGAEHIEASVRDVVTRLRRHFISEQEIITNIHGIVDVFVELVKHYGQDRVESELLGIGTASRDSIIAILKKEPNRLHPQLAYDLVNEAFCREWTMVMKVARFSTRYVRRRRHHCR